MYVKHFEPNNPAKIHKDLFFDVGSRELSFDLNTHTTRKGTNFRPSDMGTIQDSATNCNSIDLSDDNISGTAGNN